MSSPDSNSHASRSEGAGSTSADETSAHTPSRREFLETTAAIASGSLLGSGVEAGAAQDPRSVRSDLFLPEEQWKDRIQAPDDGKRYGWLVDARRCFGCHGCEVACKAENDVPLGHYIRQTVYHDYERSDGRGFARVMVPLSCQHCEDAPCIKACPCGAMHKGAGGSVQVDYDKCSGHASCKEACPYGAIYIDPVANQAIKCHNCTHRLDVGMEPACVSTCPSEALVFGDLADPDSRISKLRTRLASEAQVETLRPQKGTRPRMEFVSDAARPMSAWEHKVPREGSSYSPDAYSVFEWYDRESGKKASDSEAGR